MQLPITNLKTDNFPFNLYIYFCNLHKEKEKKCNVDTNEILSHTISFSKKILFDMLLIQGLTKQKYSSAF